MTEEQRETAEHLAEAMRIFNETARKAVKLGLVVEVSRVDAHHPAGTIPWINVSANLK